MPQENYLIMAMARLARIPFWLLARHPVIPPQRALMIQPGSMSQVMLTTPLLAALSQVYPEARFDWVINDWSRPAIAGNPHITELLSIRDHFKESIWGEMRTLVRQISEGKYDTCFIPDHSLALTWLAWRAGIPQRIGLNIGGHGFAHTIVVRPPADRQHKAAIYLSLTTALGINSIEKGEETLPGMEFYPTDTDRTAVTRRLIDELEWLGDIPLVVMHPGGGYNPMQTNIEKRWPVERFALLGNHLIRQHRASVLLVGGDIDRPLAEAVTGLMASPVPNWAGRISLGELGALCEVADLYIGNDTGPTYIAAAMSCPTLAIFGPSQPEIASPYAPKGYVTTLWHEGGERPFSWDAGITVAEAIKAADKLLTHDIRHEHKE